VRALALIEAVLDFSDEADVTEGPIAEANAIAVGLKGELDAALSDLARAETVRSGLTIVLSGPPNVGKSSLLNRLAARDVAIVTEKAGTTRDLLEVPLDLGGMKVTLVDSAGLRETDDPIEREGVLRARRAAETADLILRLTEGPITDGGYDTGGATPIWHIATKSDLYLDPDDPMHADGGHPRHRVSAKTGDGIDDLITDLVDWACEHAGSIELPLVTRRRQYDWIADAAAALTSFTAHPTEQLELKAEDLRRAATALARLTGLIDPEDVLDSLFAGFCIGK
ncbi:MAG: GTPase, partial [Pseudomonadota bacterium]